MKSKTLLVIYPGQEVHRDQVFTILVAETGECLASHICSDSGFAYDDLYGGRPERVEEWGKRFGGIEVKFINQTGISEDELLERNQKFYSELSESEK
jgi:hypothetical protein